MKFLHWKFILFVTALSFVVSPVLAETLVLEPVEEPASEVAVIGSANVTDWEARSQNVQGQVEVSQDFWREGRLSPVEDLTDTEANPRVKVEIPASSLRSVSQSDGMDKNMHKYLKTEQHPMITYDLTLAQADSVEREFELQAQGELSVAGTTKEVSFPTSVSLHEDEEYLTVEGEVDTTMTNFNIDPPTAMFGSIWAHDEITLAFRWHLAPAEQPESQ